MDDGTGELRLAFMVNPWSQREDSDGAPFADMARTTLAGFHNVG